MKVILYGNQWRIGIRKTVNRSCFRHISAYERNGKIAVDKFPHTEGVLDVLPVLSCHVECVVLMSREK